MRVVAPHPTRLAGAVVATGTVALASALTAAGAGLLDLRLGLVPEVMGGLLALNTALFLQPGTLVDQPRKLLPVLAVNVLPLPITVLLYRTSPALADAALIAMGMGAMLARSFGPFRSAIVLIATINVLIALLLGAAFGFYWLGPIAGVLGSGVALLGDHVATRLQRGIGLRAERTQLVNTAAAFLGSLADRLRAPEPWPKRWFVPYRDRVRAIVADVALTLPAGAIGPAQAPDHFVSAIAACAVGLHATEAKVPSQLAATATRTLTGMAAALRTGASERATLLAKGLIEDGRNMIAGQAFGLGLLLRDFVPAVLSPAIDSRTVELPTTSGRPGRAEIHLAVQVGTALAVAIVVSDLIGVPRPYWIPLTTLIVASASFGESLLKAAERVLGTVAGLLTGQVAWMLLRERPDMMIGVIAIAVFGIFFCRTGPYRWILFWLTMALSALLHVADAGEASYLARLGDTLIGALIAVVVCRILLPVQTRQAALARRNEYLTAVAARLRKAAEVLRQPSVALPPALFDQTVSRPFAALHALADAETVEAVVHRPARLAVRQRLAAADRLARCLVALQTVIPVLATTADPAMAAGLARIADAAAGVSSPPEYEAFAAHAQRLVAAPAAGHEQAERLTAELRLLRLLAAMSDAVVVLREGLQPCPADVPRSPC